MGPVQWSNIPGGILYVVAKFLDSDMDLLRLRSVCSSWRCCLSPRPHKPFSFPLKLPPISPYSELLCSNGEGGNYTLHENTLYRLSPLAHGARASNPSNGWMFKVSKINANTYSILIPLSSDKMHYPPETIPKQLNVFDYQIYEICKSYSLKAINQDGSSTELVEVEGVKKVITLRNYVANCDFAVLTLHHGGTLNYWKHRDENWNPVDTKGHKIDDMILYDGKCYAIDNEGVLVSFDSNFVLKIAVASSCGTYPAGQENYLVECNSDLYVVSKAYGLGPEFFYDYSDRWETFVDFALMLSKFNKNNGNWDEIRCLGDKVFLLGEDISIGVSIEDFQGCKGNCVYLADWCFIDDSESDVYGDMAGVYHLDNRKAIRMAMEGDSRKLYWPPPSWLMPPSSSSEW